MPFLLFIAGCIILIISVIGLHISLIHLMDTSFVVWTNTHRNVLFNAIAVKLSLLGGLPFTVIIGTIGCLLLYKSKKYAEVLFVLLSIAGGATIGWLLKYIINRPRPDEIYRMVETYGASFPSAHSIYAAVLGCCVMLILHKHTRARLFITLAGLWLVLMGLSRVYLGAHYPTDVLAGWGIGLIWTTFLWFILSHYTLKRNELFLNKNPYEVE